MSGETASKQAVDSKWLSWATLVVLLGAVVAIGAIALGIFDPKPLGEIQRTVRLAPASLSPESSQISWLGGQPPTGPSFTVRLIAAHLNGELDSGYGLVLEHELGYQAFALSPLGYVAIWAHGEAMSKDAGSDERFDMPWQRWPHVRTDKEENEIWIDVVPVSASETAITVRVNRERLWIGKLNGVPTRVGTIGMSFGLATVIDFRELQLFSPQ
jgi:hypothetical protein